MLTATGADKVGIVDEFSKPISDLGCNIEESKMAVLGGEFAIIMLVSGVAESMEKLLGEMEEIGSKTGLVIQAKTTGPHSEAPTGRPYLIETVSLDTPGIVNGVSNLLRINNISIDELETETSGAPFTGAPMFRMRITAIVPNQVRVAKLRAELESVAAEHDLDIMIRPVVVRPDE